MDWTTLIGPAVVAATISGLVGGIGIWISARNSRAIHTEKLAFDAQQAERRASTEIALAERKVALDRELAAWKRRADLAEETLVAFYEARDSIRSARSPLIFEGEGSTRQKEAWETENDTRTLNAYFAAAERLARKSEVFAQIQARRYRFVALFGEEAAGPYDEIFRVRHEIMAAVRELVGSHRYRDQIPQLTDRRERWAAVVGLSHEGDDPIAIRLDQAIGRVERICRAAIQGIAQ